MTTTTEQLVSADPAGPHFVSMRGTGFQIFFDNGWGVSIQFGVHNYCENRSRSLQRFDSIPALTTCRDSEIAVIDPAGNLLHLANDSVEGWVKPDVAAKMITVVREFARDIGHEEATSLCAAVLGES
jgi:hypothetical protein